MAITNPSSSDEATASKYQNSSIVGDTSIGSLLSNTGKSVGSYLTSAATNLLGFGKRAVPGVPQGALPQPPHLVQTTVTGKNGTVVNKDLRVQIRVPSKYFTSFTAGPYGQLQNLGAVIFPYTPAISYEHKADYSNSNPTHSNFAIYFYKNSSISPITITGKFTVQNETDAGMYLATLHLLRSLTKMRSGGSNGDVDSGAPPPVCRLDAYGQFMMDNTPVVINSFRVELPDGVDYYRLGKISGQAANTVYDQASVPTISTIAITCIPVYSRQEMQDFSVTGWLNNPNSRKSGYL